MTESFRPVPLIHCARCGENHSAVTFRPLANPPPPSMIVSGVTHWGVCPALGQPVFMLLDPAPRPTPKREPFELAASPQEVADAIGLGGLAGDPSRLLLEAEGIMLRAECHLAANRQRLGVISEQLSDSEAAAHKLRAAFEWLKTNREKKGECTDGPSNRQSVDDSGPAQVAGLPGVEP